MAKTKTVSLLEFLKCGFDLNRMYKDITVSSDYNSLSISLSRAYKIMKKAASAVNNSFFRKLIYEYYKDMLFECECEIDNCYILLSEPLFRVNDPNFVNTSFDSFNYVEEKLDYIVWVTRKELLKRLHNYDSSINSLSNVDLTNECKDTSYLVSSICKELGINVRVIKIPPAFTDEVELFGGNGYHYFTLVTINERFYLIDCTYRQFFKLEKNLFDRMGVMGCSGCGPGAYMMIDDSRRETAIQILRRGWIEVDEVSLKSYLDGFALANRNGLFYEQLGKVEYTVPYSSEMYIDFLRGVDHQLNYEPIECLGEQKQPLKNRRLNFRRY